MFNEDSHSAILNASFSGNLANNLSGGIYNANSSPTIVNSILWHNGDNTGTGTITSTILNIGNSTPTISYSLVQGSGGSSSWNSSVGTDGGNNIESDPLFVAVIDLTLAPTTTGNLQLQATSPAIDVGNTLSNSTSLDLANNLRVYNSIIDMGAYEYTQHQLTVSLDGDGSGSISSLPTGINCGLTCTINFDHGTVVTLTATADLGSTFTGWSGACNGTGSCAVIMTTAQTVTATFALDRFDIFLPLVMK